MKFKLERAIAVGDGWVAALVRQTVCWRAGAGPWVFSADKHPVAILLVCAGQVRAFTPAGEPLAIEAVERCCPGATAQFMHGRPGGPGDTRARWRAP